MKHDFEVPRTGWRSRSASLIVLCLLVGLTAAALLMADTANAD